MKNIFVFYNSLNGFASNVTDSIKRFFVKSCMCIINNLFVPINNDNLYFRMFHCRPRAARVGHKMFGHRNLFQNIIKPIFCKNNISFYICIYIDNLYLKQQEK